MGIPFNVQVARAEFLLALQDRCPEAMTDLKNLCEPYRQAAPHLVPAETRDWPSVAQRRYLTEVADLVGGMEGWANRYRIQDEWILQSAFMALRRANHEAAPVEFVPFLVGTVSGATTFEFRSDSQADFGEGKSSVRERIRKEFFEKLDSFLDRLYAQIPEEPRQQPEVQRNARWAVEHFALRWSYEEIARHDKLGDPVGSGKVSVYQAVKRFCLLAGLDSRD